MAAHRAVCEVRCAPERDAALGRDQGSMIVIVYTTRYREGGARFAQAARTFAARLRAERPTQTVWCRAVESKACVQRVFAAASNITEFHFIGHGGLYGPMFGTTTWPEQFSPHEWRELDIPFAAEAQAHFHACRSARWFAPFFAQTFGVRTLGYHWYTAFSASPHRFEPLPPWHPPTAPLYVAGCPGRKSHGAAASVRKYLGRMPLETPVSFEPGERGGSYDAVAADYDAVFDDIDVRRDELRWLRAHLPGGSPDVLDLGCGNGALLEKLSPSIRSGVGLDASERMVELATQRNASRDALRFEVIDGPKLPLPDASLDVAVSLLSFRYLDWDPLMLELQRVLRPGGRLLVIDMVERPAGVAQLPRLLADKLRVRARELRHPGYVRARAQMVRSPAWARMLRFNPMRAFHEYDWYLGSRFPAGTLDVLNVGRRAQVIAFDTGPFRDAALHEMAYP
ncbi:MAG: class I SAM-dependent methyltransferase [Nannocystaceae bacterium]|nr:class I SAM-dependent methyltransferase [Nannocystaceae bacterium]